MKNSKIRFRAILLLSGKTATGVEVPEHIVEKLGSSKKPPVKVTINGYTYRSSIAKMGGIFMLGMSAEVRQNSGIKSGDMITIDLETDTEPRVVSVPADFQQALGTNMMAKEFFDSLSYSSQRRYVLQIEQAKTEDTRKRRIEKTITDLVNHKK